MKCARLKKRLERSAWLTLLAGGLASTAIYLTASPDEQNGLVEGFRGSKAYRHELEAYGGKLIIVSNELIYWFSSLWQGETLAFTVAFIALSIALLLFCSSRCITVIVAEHDLHNKESESKG